nr:MLO-like protein 8 [Tanacetum cinerariifolium]GEY64821.1 MLO-like protein 8 [Tanacetum cinerariifolium]
ETSGTLTRTPSEDLLGWPFGYLLRHTKPHQVSSAHLQPIAFKFPGNKVSDEILGKQSCEFWRTSSLCVVPVRLPEVSPEHLSEMSSGGLLGDTSEVKRQLDQTPTWAVAGVCAVIIVISIALEKVLHIFGNYLTGRRKKALFQALEKVKAELMILGFISLILTFSQSYIAKICLPVSVGDTMLPCAKRDKPVKEEIHRVLLWYEHGRSLAESSASSCNKGKAPIITVDGLHQLHILIFFLAILHVVFSAITMILGRLKTRGWKHWEAEALSPDHAVPTGASQIRLTHESSFVRAHTSSWTRLPIVFYIGCFFRQFFGSIRRSDYLTLRSAFINLHLAPGNKFNFQKYIKRSLEDDFQVVVGISPVLWASFVIFCLLNVNGWHVIFWASLIPLVIILAVGTELQVILTRMALDTSQRRAVVQGDPLVLSSDKYFWLSRPRLLLHLIHFALFQNAFQITYFLWIWYEYGINSCINDDIRLLIVKLVIGERIFKVVAILYVQMGSDMKKTIFDEQTAKALKQWRMQVKKKQGDKGGKSQTRALGNDLAASPIHSTPMHPIANAMPHRLEHSVGSTSYEDADTSSFVAEPLSRGSSIEELNDVVVDKHNDNIVQLDTSAKQKNEDEICLVKQGMTL